jgi:hypothetical protein
MPHPALARPTRIRGCVACHRNSEQKNPRCHLKSCRKPSAFTASPGTCAAKWRQSRPVPQDLERRELIAFWRARVEVCKIGILQARLGLQSTIRRGLAANPDSLVDKTHPYRKPSHRFPGCLSRSHAAYFDHPLGYLIYHRRSEMPCGELVRPSRKESYGGHFHEIERGITFAAIATTRESQRSAEGQGCR